MEVLEQTRMGPEWCATVPWDCKELDTTLRLNTQIGYMDSLIVKGITFLLKTVVLNHISCLNSWFTVTSAFLEIINEGLSLDKKWL